MNLQTFIEAVPGYLWSDGNGSTSGLAMTAELFCSPGARNGAGGAVGD